MTIDQIKQTVASTEYDFLRTNPNLGSNIVLLGLGGSHAYGMEQEDSDLDIRGTALLRAEAILSGTCFESIVDDATDTTIYNFNKFVYMLANANPNTLEILGLKPEHYLHISKYGQLLLDNKKLFLSQRCIKSFGEYSKSQMYRLMQKTQSAMSELEYEQHIASVLQRMSDRLSTKFDVHLLTSVSADNKAILNGELKDFPMEHATAVLSELNQTYSQYKKNSHRNDNADAHGKMAKHAGHTLRTLIMGIDVLEKEIIKTYRDEEHELLMDISNGKYMDEDNKPNSAFFDIFHEYEKRFNYAADNTSLPERPDMDKINELVLDATKYVLYNI